MFSLVRRSWALCAFQGGRKVYIKKTKEGMAAPSRVLWELQASSVGSPGTSLPYLCECTAEVLLSKHALCIPQC